MRQDCLLCERTSPDNNLYCQEIYCPAEMSPTILDRGEWLGNIEIVNPIVVLRSSVLYEARHQKKRVLLKVAHPGPENRERLKREAEFLKTHQRAKDRNEFLPVLLPPYTNASVEREPYGRVVLQGHLLYYCLFEHFPGESLRGMLANNVQMWVYHIGWIMTRLATAVAFLQSKGILHCGLSPDCVLVYVDDESGAPRILLFDLGVVSDQANFTSNWYPFFVHPAYTAPELINTTMPRATYATDVYGLGLILYELLIGEPAFPYKLYRDDEVYAAVQDGQPVPMTRSEDVRSVAKIAEKAVDKNAAARYQTAAELATHLREGFGEAPEKKSFLNMKMVLLVGGGLLIIALLIVAVVGGG